MVSDISMYLDKNFVGKEKLKSIWELGILLFKKNIFKQKDIHDMFLRLIFEEIEHERKGNQIRQEIVRNSLQILIDLGISSTSVYKKEFQVDFIYRTGQFYGTEAAS